MIRLDIKYKEENIYLVCILNNIYIYTYIICNYIAETEVTIHRGIYI